MDLRGIISYKMYFYSENLRSFFSTIITIFILFLKGIKLSKNLKFFGIPLVVRHPNSKIQFGNNSRFRSGFRSNLIGVNRRCIISTHSEYAEIVIGENCGFSGTSIGCLTQITLGDNVLCGANTLITDFDWHNLNPSKRHLQVEKGKAINISDNVFIGYGAIILKGVSIGKNSVIGAYSVVSSDIPADCIAAGNPCRVLSYFRDTKKTT